MAVIADATNHDVRRDRNMPTGPPALRMAARSYRHLSGVDVVWQTGRESRAQTPGIRCRDGARSPAGLGLAIEPGIGVGGAPLLTLEPRPGDVAGEGRKIRRKQASFGKGRAVEFELPVAR